jgi:hypothetical protein
MDTRSVQRHLKLMLVSPSHTPDLHFRQGWRKVVNATLFGSSGRDSRPIHADKRQEIHSLLVNYQRGQRRSFTYHGLKQAESLLLLKPEFNLREIVVLGGDHQSADILPSAPCRQRGWRFPDKFGAFVLASKRALECCSAARAALEKNQAAVTPSASAPALSDVDSPPRNQVRLHLSRPVCCAVRSPSRCERHER